MNCDILSKGPWIIHADKFALRTKVVTPVTAILAGSTGYKWIQHHICCPVWFPETTIPAASCPRISGGTLRASSPW